MTLELRAIGGYNIIGRQSTALKVDQDAVIIDLGLHLDHYIRLTEDDEEDITTTSERTLRKAGAIPDTTIINDWKSNIRAIILTHAHLDHIGAVPYLAAKFDVPIYGSPFTIALLKQLIDDKKLEVPNELIAIQPGSRFTLTDKIDVEFIHNTHSTVGAVFLALHTPYGIVTCDNDYKLDNHPTFGEPPDYARFKELGGHIVAHIGECLYAGSPAKTPSESVARQMLAEVLLEQDFEGRTVFVSTFSSHIARLLTIMDIGKAMERKVVFMGRSMAKYLAAAEEAELITIPKHVTVLKYGSQVKGFFKKHSDLSKYLVVCTGHMGEPKAALSKILDGKFPFKFKQDDVVVFSSRVIPVPNIIASREELDRKLRELHVRFFNDVHVSGHASREDIRWMLTTLKPEHVIPNHGISSMTESYIALAKEVGIPSENIHSMHEGDRLVLRE